ncbi:HARB1-like protein [Mya arenaria]|uniref:HARB1-like protein n=1 Tax=Mya arenaria TaxID=6604 RepID=A0ABY7G745_MYAAR|nr:HARB1-like protein [Mya arenaria]
MSIKRDPERFSNDNIDRLVDLLTDRLKRPTQNSLTVLQQVMIALRFYASGAFLQVIGDTFGVDIATVSRRVTDVTNALFDLRDRAIKFPTEAADLQAAKSAVYARTNFPSVVGCIDGTHIHIQSPGGLDEGAYVNRKRRHSSITSISARLPGSCHDAHVWRTSSICKHMEVNHQGNGSEERFDKAHVKTRNIIEIVFGEWKRKFHVLHGEKYKISYA